MEGVRRLLQRRWILAALALAVVAPVIVVFARKTGGGDTPTTSAARTAAAVQTRTSDETLATALVRRFIQAYNTADRDELYAVQSDEYKAVCSREQFNAVPVSNAGTQLSGPNTIRFQQDVAAAAVTTTLADGTTASNQVPLVRASDGSWRIAPPSQTGCLP